MSNNISNKVQQYFRENKSAKIRFDMNLVFIIATLISHTSQLCRTELLCLIIRQMKFFLKWSIAFYHWYASDTWMPCAQLLFICSITLITSFARYRAKFWYMKESPCTRHAIESIAHLHTHTTRIDPQHLPIRNCQWRVRSVEISSFIPVNAATDTNLCARTLYAYKTRVLFKHNELRIFARVRAVSQERWNKLCSRSATVPTALTGGTCLVWWCRFLKRRHWAACAVVCSRWILIAWLGRWERGL